MCSEGNKVDEVWPIHSAFSDHCLPNSSQAWPTSARLGPYLSGPSVHAAAYPHPEIPHNIIWPTSGQHRPNVARARATYGSLRPTFGQHRQILAEREPDLPKLGQHQRTRSVILGRCSSNCQRNLGATSDLAEATKGNFQDARRLVMARGD